MLYYYYIYGLNVESELVLEEAYEIERPDKIDIRISESAIDHILVNETEEELLRGKGWVLYHKDNWIGTRFVHEGAFLVDDGKEIKYKLRPECNMKFINQIVIIFCMSIILLQRKNIALHGSGIVIKGKAIVISGNSGAGKSTLTTAYLKQDIGFLSDDIVATTIIDGKIYAQSGYPQRKLCTDTVEEFNMNHEDYDIIPDYEKEKFGIMQLHNYHPDSIELAALIVLKPEEVSTPVLSEICGSEKLKYVIENLFNKRLYRYFKFGPEEMQKCIAIASSIKIYALKRPINKMTVDEQVELISKIEL